MFTAVLFTIVKTWKQPRCPSTDEWIKNLWYVFTMKYYSAIKRNKCEPVVVRWMNLELVIQSEVKSEREKYPMHIYVSATLSIQITFSFLHCVHKSVLYVCLSIPALQIGSSVSFF